MVLDIFRDMGYITRTYEQDKYNLQLSPQAVEYFNEFNGKESDFFIKN